MRRIHDRLKMPKSPIIFLQMSSIKFKFSPKLPALIHPWKSQTAALFLRWIKHWNISDFVLGVVFLTVQRYLEVWRIITCNAFQTNISPITKDWTYCSKVSINNFSLEKSISKGITSIQNPDARKMPKIISVFTYDKIQKPISKKIGSTSSIKVSINTYG